MSQAPDRLFEDVMPWLGPLSGVAALVAIASFTVGRGDPLSILIGSAAAFVAVGAWIEWRLRAALDLHFTRSTSPLDDLLRKRSAALEAWHEDRVDTAHDAAAQEAALNAFLENTRASLTGEGSTQTPRAATPKAQARPNATRKPARQVEKTVPLAEDDLLFFGERRGAAALSEASEASAEAPADEPAEAQAEASAEREAAESEAAEAASGGEKGVVPPAAASEAPGP